MIWFLINEILQCLLSGISYSKTFFIHKRYDVICHVIKAKRMQYVIELHKIVVNETCIFNALIDAGARSSQLQRQCTDNCRYVFNVVFCHNSCIDSLLFYVSHTACVANHIRVIIFGYYLLIYNIISNNENKIDLSVNQIGNLYACLQA